MNSSFQKKIPLLVLALLRGACTALRPGPSPVSENPAVLTLVEQARADAAQDKLQSAAGTVERALRIEPRNPRLWQELVKMERVWQRDYANHLEAVKDITGYIVGFYNGVRLYSTLGNLSPMIYEMELAA